MLVMTHDDHRYRKKKSWKFILYFFCGRLGTIYSTFDEVNFAKENLLTHHHYSIVITLCSFP